MDSTQWFIESFDTINRYDWHNILELRQLVFVVEQFCPYPDLDGKDLNAIHLYAKANEDIIAYSRILNVGISYPEFASIGRIITNPKYRGQQYGKQLLEKSIQLLKENFGEVPVKISAQGYLEKFYNKFGFKRVGDLYLEDDIPHYEMEINWTKVPN